jgi:prolyl-tRNA synthetase
MKPGAKYYEWERKGVPLRLELGPRDIDSGEVMAKRRVAPDGKEKLPLQDIGVHVGRVLDEFQKFLYGRAQARCEEDTVTVDSWEEFEEVFADQKSTFCWAHWDGTSETELAIKGATKATIRCVPLTDDGPAPEQGVCVKSGKPSRQRVLFAKNY